MKEFGWKYLQDLKRKRDNVEIFKKEIPRFLGLIIIMAVFLVEFCLIELCIY